MDAMTDRILGHLPRTFRKGPLPEVLHALLDPIGGELEAAESRVVEVLRAHLADYAGMELDGGGDLARLAALFGLTPTALDATAGQFREHLRRVLHAYSEGAFTVQGVLRVVAAALDLPLLGEYADLDAWWRRPGGDALVTAVPRGEDAAAALFGMPWAEVRGRETQPAQILGTVDLGERVALGERAVLRVAMDGPGERFVDLSQATELEDVIAVVNDAFDAPVAAARGTRLLLSSVNTGPAARLEVLEGPDDAALALLGLLPSVYRGRDATAARLVGAPDLSGVISLDGAHTLRLAVDGESAVEVDLGSRETTLNEVVRTINAVLPGVASAPDGKHLVLNSPLVGRKSAIEVETSGAGDACRRLMGRGPLLAFGSDAVPAQLIGAADLCHGVDLSRASVVQVLIDNRMNRTIDCSGADPAHTYLSEIVDAFNLNLGAGVAHHDGHYVTLSGTCTGSGGYLAVSAPPGGSDALTAIFGIRSRCAEGVGASRAVIAGKVDLEKGANLWRTHVLRISVDGTAAVDVDLRAVIKEAAGDGDETIEKLAAVPPTDLAQAINQGIGAVVAFTDGHSLTLTSPTTGSGSSLALLRVEDVEARRFTSRAYFADEHALALFDRPQVSAAGAEAAPAHVTGRADLSRGVDLTHARFLQITLDREPPRLVDCAAGAPRPRVVTPDEIVTAINRAFDGREVASHVGRHLRLTSPTSGGRSRIKFGRAEEADAFAILLREAPRVTQGRDPQPAVIRGPAVQEPLDFSKQHVLRVAVDRAPWLDVDVAGAEPRFTFLEEVAAAINRTLPGLARLVDGRLQLTSPTCGEDSSLEVLPVRTLDLVEYLPEPRADGPREVRHGDRWVTVEDGAASSFRFELTSEHGLVGPELYNLTDDRRVRVAMILNPGERLWVEPDTTRGVRATIVNAAGEEHAVPGDKLLIGPAGVRVWTLDGSEATLQGGEDGVAARLQLNNPLAPRVVLLKARRPGRNGSSIRIAVAAANLAPPSPAPSPPAYAPGAHVRLTGRVRAAAGGWQLVDASEIPMAALSLAPGASLAELEGRPVALHGRIYPLLNALPRLLVADAQLIFDITISRPDLGGGAVDAEVTERYAGVTVGASPDAEDELAWQIYAREGGKGSQLVVADVFEKAEALALAPGRTEWLYRQCNVPRFDAVSWQSVSLPGRGCREAGIFGLSQFAERGAREDDAALYAMPTTGAAANPPALITLHWTHHRPGTLAVHLPGDLPSHFGARFDEGRFGIDPGEREAFTHVVTEPADDADYLVTRLAASRLVRAEVAAAVPEGTVVHDLPFARPHQRKLTSGKPGEPARLYLRDPGLLGTVFVLSAREAGAWGNAIGVTVRKGGPARFDLWISFRGAVFECAVETALAGEPLVARAGEAPYGQEPGPAPAGLLHARAAGIYTVAKRAQR
jgi:hypothetical protein